MPDHTTDAIHAAFWDIESIENAFTNCVYDHDYADPATGLATERLDVFFLTNGIEGFPTFADDHDPAYTEARRLIAARIRERNSNFHGRIYFHDLSKPDHNSAMARIFGISDAGCDEAADWADSMAAKAKREGRDTRGFPGRELGNGNVIANNPRYASTFGPECRGACDTDVDGAWTNQAGQTFATRAFDERVTPYLMGYNSFNYDTTMLAFYFAEALNDKGQTGEYEWAPPAPQAMRAINDALFDPDIIDRMSLAPAFAYDERARRFDPAKRLPYGRARRPEAIRRNMICSGRHIDVARLNEKQYKTGLKRLLGMLGLQILESDKLRSASRIEDLDQFADLVAYNVSDVVNLRELFLNRAYFTQFENKRHLMERYPDTVYDCRRVSEGDYEAIRDPEHVRIFRLTPDSKSAQFAAHILCPSVEKNSHLTDIPAVSFDYPSTEQAKTMGIERYNVLESCKYFIEANFGPGSPVWDEFKPVYDYYKSIEGKNLNDSKNYELDHPTDGLPAIDLSSIPKGPSCVRYWTKDERGNPIPTDCYANFSTGGIHGAQMDIWAYREALALWMEKKAQQDYAKAIFKGDAVACRRAKTFTMTGQVHAWQEVLRASLPIAKSEWKDLDATMPRLFVENKDGSTKLHPKWSYTSAYVTNHEDFSSYYPNMLRAMDAFKNPNIKEDRYGDIYDQKQSLGAREKDMGLTENERKDAHLTREGTKLILNAATGKADSRNQGVNPIRVNNQIMSMRIIGQLFSWRIGQAQALEGAKVVSTNTDGLYTVMDEGANRTILKRESERIHVEIEPEPVFLISKDANNRMECDPKDHHRVFDARGGSLACRLGPDPTKSLAHPAIQDWLTAEYLICATDGEDGHPTLADSFDENLGRALIDRAFSEMDTRHLLLMLSNIVASSPGSKTFVFAENENGAKALQHYNRIFIVKDRRPDDENVYHLRAAHARKITPAVRQRRKRDQTREIQHDELALRILHANGIPRSELDAMNQTYAKKVEAAVKRFPGIDPEAWVVIENRALNDLTKDEIEELLERIDRDAYVKAAAESFEKNWRWSQ